MNDYIVPENNTRNMLCIKKHPETIRVFFERKPLYVSNYTVGPLVPFFVHFFAKE